MGTKNNPGKFDCYAKAGPDEPLFILRGTDAAAPLIVRLWAAIREETHGAADSEMLSDAMACSDAMQGHSTALGKEAGQKAAAQAFAKISMTHLLQVAATLPRDMRIAIAHKLVGEGPEDK